MTQRAFAQPALSMSSADHRVEQVLPVTGMSAYDVVARAGMRNTGDAATNVAAQITRVAPNALIVDGSVSFGSVSPTSGTPVLSTDTFTVRFIVPPEMTPTHAQQLLPREIQSVRWSIECGNCQGNRSPVANAGAAQTVSVGAPLTLDGSASSDADGDPLAFRWSIVSSPANVAVTLSDATAVRPTLVLPAPGTYVAQLVVSDGSTTSAPSAVTLTTINSSPVANAGLDRSVVPGSRVTLNGSASSDVDGDPLVYEWTLIETPAGSEASFLNADPASPIADFVVDRSGRYVAQLTVRDTAESSATDSVIVTTENAAPIANAGPDVAVRLGDSVELSGARSLDPDGHPLEFRWSLTAPPASAASLSANAGVTTHFAPDVPGSYLVQLIVSDGAVDSEPDVVVVSTTNSRPIADAGPDVSVLPGAEVPLDGSASWDADGDSLSFAWSLLSAPPGSSASLLDREFPTAVLLTDVPGLYVAQLIVDDGALSSDPSTTTVEVLVQDTSEPQIRIDSPGLDSVTRDTAVTIVGQLSEAASLRIDGVPVALDAQLRFSHAVSLREGLNRLSIDATDIAGNTGSAVLTIERDTVAPAAPIVARISADPRPGELVRVRGSVQSVDSGVTVQVTNTRTGVSVTTVASGDGDFEVLLNGRESDSFVVVAVDAAGNHSEAAMLPGVEEGELRLEIAAPVDGAQMNDRVVLVRGSLSGPLDVGVSINGVSAVLLETNGRRSFQVQQSLLSGENVIDVVAERPDGTRVARQLRVTRASARAFGASLMQPTGVAPFDALFEIAQYEEGDVAEVTIDQDSNGSIDVRSPSDDRYIAVRYENSGSFEATVSIRTAAGEVITSRVPVTIQTPDEIGRQVHRTWNALTDALRASNLPVALSLLTPTAAGRYGPAFQQLGSNLPSITDAFGTLSISYTSSEIAEGVIARSVEGVDRAFIVTFLKTRDGRWRVASF